MSTYIPNKEYNDWEDLVKKNPVLAEKITKEFKNKGFSFGEVKDCSTIFSIVPFEVREFKPGIYPGWFIIPRCEDDDEPSRLLIDRPSKHMMHVGGQKKPIVLETNTATIAKSVVTDFLGSQLYTTADAKPGITFIQGNVSLEEFKVVYSDEYKRIKKSQDRWLLNVIKETDNDWNRYHNLRVVSDHARFAARKFKLDKEWLRDAITALEDVHCIACRSKIDKEAIVCPICRTVQDPIKFKEMGLSLAGA